MDSERYAKFQPNHWGTYEELATRVARHAIEHNHYKGHPHAGRGVFPKNDVFTVPILMYNDTEEFYVSAVSYALNKTNEPKGVVILHHNHDSSSTFVFYIEDGELEVVNMC